VSQAKREPTQLNGLKTEGQPSYVDLPISVQSKPVVAILVQLWPIPRGFFMAYLMALRFEEREISHYFRGAFDGPSLHRLDGGMRMPIKESLLRISELAVCRFALFWEQPDVRLL
jgi:hypothetical protein